MLSLNSILLKTARSVKGEQNKKLLASKNLKERTMNLSLNSCQKASSQNWKPCKTGELLYGKLENTGVQKDRL